MLEELSSLTAISPIDGRYASKTSELRSIFSEYGLIKNRYKIEIMWLIFLSQQNAIAELGKFSDATISQLEDLVSEFDLAKAQKIKEIEKETNHDVKAVEYQIREDLDSITELKNKKQFIHFACTSEDINNLSYALMLEEGRDLIISKYASIQNILNNIINVESNTPMLSHTHGQPATPTTLGKELANVSYRIARQEQQLQNIRILAKINGATGNYNAHYIAVPETNWIELCEDFCASILGLTANPMTTQIEPHDFIAEIMHNIIRINNIFLDFSRDIWTYISIGYFTQKLKDKEIGSSTMPHKVNPIDFENAEGNLGLANALAEHLASKLTISRMQRDLSDSTVLRSLGSVFAYSFIALSSLEKGLNKLNTNREKILEDLQNNPEILAEAVQTVMRRYGITNAYEQLKELTRGKKLNLTELASFIDSLDIPNEAKDRLKKLKPETYLGQAEFLAKRKNKIY